jgi:hypothetical protein
MSNTAANNEETQKLGASKNNSISSQPMRFGETVNYQICVQGRIDPDWPGRLEGMLISPAAEQDTITLLEGELRDQAALAGLVNTLYELHLPVLSLKWLNIW